MVENNRQGQLHAKLLEESGFSITKEELMYFFVADNMHKKEGEECSASIQKLQEHGFRHGITQALKSDVNQGLDADDIQVRRRIYGKNEKHKRKIRTVCDMICDVFDDLILKVLIVACIISTTLGIVQHGVATGFQEGAGILFAIIIIVTVTVGNDYTKEKKFQELMSQADVKTVNLMRSNKPITIDSEELVVGDIIFIGYGDAVPADCLVITADDAFASEAALTGEPEDLQKEPVTEENLQGDPFMLQGSEIMKGKVKAMVLAVGDNTCQGQAGLSMNIEAEETPLQMKLNSIAEGIGKLGVAVALLTLAAIVISTIVTTVKDDAKNFDIKFWKDIANGFVIAITVVVVAVPEGLPLAVTISLAFSVKKMQKDNNLVRKLGSSETMGNATEICTDKTGTLTQNRMNVQSSFFEYGVYNHMSKDQWESLASKNIIKDCLIWNTDAFYEMKKNEETGVEEEKGTGNVTEIGLLDFIADFDNSVKDEIQARFKTEPLFNIPLNSMRKRASAVYSKDSNNVRVYCKGAPDFVMEFCSQLVSAGNEVVELTQEHKDHILRQVQVDFASQTLRCILIAYRDLTMEEFEQLKNSENPEKAIESNLTCVGMFGLKDPLRPGITDAVTRCRNAGINVRMITGDGIATAKAISVEAGILTEEDLALEHDQEYVCMEGNDFMEKIKGVVRTEKTLKEKKDDEDQDDVYETKVVAEIGDNHKFNIVARKLKVMARSQPEHKFMLVDGLIKKGETVAVTGDGTNDAPALNRADVGFAMGITGTDVAKSACDIQLLDDNFCSILTAVKYGRNIYDNVRKFLQFQLTVNVVAMFIVFCGACIFAEPPLTSTQMLWVNLIMDTFAALALATEPPANTVFDRLPAKKSDLIVNPVMWRNILMQSLYQIVWLLLLLFYGGQWFGIKYDYSDPLYPTDAEVDLRISKGLNINPETAWKYGEPTNKVTMYTMIFQSFVFLQLFNQINARKLGERDFNAFKNFFNNWLFVFITLLTFGIQVAIVQFAGRFMSVVPINWEQNLYCLAIGASCLIYNLFVKCIPAWWFGWIRLEEREQAGDSNDTFMSTVRRQSTMSSKKTLHSSQKRPGWFNSKQAAVGDDDNYTVNN